MRNFKDLIIYEVYLRSFKDSNGDGIGDFNGLREKLDYLQSLGINTVWVSPCYKSPNFDNGYDISNYQEISEEFGTINDFKKLLSEMHKRNMKLIMDLVVNHTSTEHKWFLEAKKSRENPYHDFYIWADRPLNKWKSCFGGSAWEYNEETKEYYLHSFSPQQADLNWENPNVRKACKDIVKFWVELGVDGFRCDVLDFISKDLRKNKMYGGKNLHAYIKQLFSGKELSGIFTLGECQSNKKNIKDICGKNRSELSAVFQFDHIELGRKTKYLSASPNYNRLKKILTSWQNFTQKNNLDYVLFTDNHDQPYYLSRMGDKTHRYQCATMLCALFFLLKGIPVIYQSQEYGSINPYYNKISDFNDVETINYYNMHKNDFPKEELMERINFSSRDNTRRPITWNTDKESAYGFSAHQPWLKVNTNAEKINIEKDLNAQQSVLRFYQDVLTLRKTEKVIRYGSFIDLTKLHKNCFIYKRLYQNKDIIVVCNFQKPKTIHLKSIVNPSDYQCILSNYKEKPSFSPKFSPYEIRVFRKTKQKKNT